MVNIKINQSQCKGCLLCTTVCPTEIIAQSKVVNAKGYYAVQVEEDLQSKCKQCGFCSLICPDAAISVRIKEVKDA